MADHNLLISSNLPLPEAGGSCAWGRLIGASTALAVAEFARRARGPILLLADDPRDADQLEAEIGFFGGAEMRVCHFVDWETLPWDAFSPHQDIVSDRLSLLATLRDLQHGVVIASAPSLLTRLPPVDYVAARSLALATGQSPASE